MPPGWRKTAILVIVGLAGCRKIQAKLGLRRAEATREGASVAAGHAADLALGKRYGEVAPDWLPGTLEWDKWPIDLRFLNDGDRPAGRHGKVRARGDQLVFEDGTVARFWGTNVVGYALFYGSKPAIANQAKRIAAMGYNIARIHHHDSDWVDPNVFDKSSGDTQKLDSSSLDMIDWWMKCLKDEGVYVWLDLHVGRHFREGDGIEGYSEIAGQKGIVKGFSYVNPRIEALMQRFAEQYLTHLNRYTGLAYKDDPALAGVLITNENDLSGHFGSLLLPNAKNPIHQRLFETQASSIASGMNLPVHKSLRTWEPGPSKIVLNEMEERFYRRAIDHLHQLGVTAPIATSSFWGGDLLSALPSLSIGDVVDAHSYGDPESLSANPRHTANFITFIGAAQIADKPLAITEWNVEYPKRDRFIAPLYLASIADLQGWDVPMIFSYLNVAVEEPTKPDTWSVSFDPAISALMPAAAIMFRQKHVQQARKTYRFEPSREDFYYKPLGPETSATLRTLVEQSRLVIGLPDIPELGWVNRGGSKDAEAIVVTAPDQDFIPPGQNQVRSDTGELERDWVAGTHTIDTPLSQAAAGWIGARNIHTRDVELRIETPKATVALTSLDERPIGSSRRILLTAVSQVVASPGDKLPFLAQPVSGAIALRSSQPSMRLLLLSSGATRDLGALPREGDRYLVRLPQGHATHWFLLEANDPTP